MFPTDIFCLIQKTTNFVTWLTEPGNVTVFGKQN